jgi:hypothetical protein
MIPDVFLAIEIGEPLVQALGTGKFLWPFTSLVPHPELELGDAVAVETDSFAMLDPTTGEAIRGPLWAIGRVAEIGDLWGTVLGIWVRGFADLWVISRNVYRRVWFEPPVVEATIFSLANQPQNATVRLRAYPATATIKYYVHADGTTAPDRDSALWLIYGGAPFTVARSSVADLLLSFFAIDNGIYGDLRTVRIAPDQTAALLNLTGSQAGGTPTITVTVTATVNANVRRIRWYARVGSWPTTDGTQGAALSQTYFRSDKSVYANGGGFDATGLPVDGAVTEAMDSLATGQHMMWIAVPLDYNGNPGPRFEYDFTEGGPVITVKPISLALNAAGTNCGAGKRKLDFSWTPNANVVDATHDLLVYKTQDGWRSLLFTEVSPKTTTVRNAVAVNAMADGTDPFREDTYDFELKAGSTIIESGSVGSDLYTGHLCLF